MSYVYLIRHGQAGTRDHYDQLSDLGREQSRLLGESLVKQGMQFSEAYCGGLRRQRETGAEVCRAYAEAGLPFPPITEQDCWREFDLDEVYRGIAPKLCDEDAEFRRDYESMLAEVKASQGEASATVHRRWSPCDIKVIQAWIRARFDYEGESWAHFRARVTAKMPSVEGNVIVFTSATPSAVWAAKGLEIEDERIMRLAGVLYNASVTVVRLRGEQVNLFSLNGAAHLPEARLRTHR